MADVVLRKGKSAVAPPAALSENAVEAIQNDREFKAHVYQQLVDLQPFLSPDSQVAVIVNIGQDDDADEDEIIDESSEPNYALTLIATLGDYRLEAKGRNPDIYEALGIAKRKMLQQLDEVYNSAIDSNERISEIDDLMQGKLTIH